MCSIILQGLLVRDIGRLLHTTSLEPLLSMDVTLAVFQAEESLPEFKEI